MPNGLDLIYIPPHLSFFVRNEGLVRDPLNKKDVLYLRSSQVVMVFSHKKVGIRVATKTSAQPLALQRVLAGNCLFLLDTFEVEMFFHPENWHFLQFFLSKRNGDILGSGELSCTRQMGHLLAKSCCVYIYLWLPTYRFEWRVQQNQEAGGWSLVKRVHFHSEYMSY